jgi:leucine--tRNA ligase
LALARQSAAKWLEGKEIIKQIYVNGKLVNFVIKG